MEPIIGENGEIILGVLGALAVFAVIGAMISKDGTFVQQIESVLLSTL